jgi:hypothetical protein
LQQAAQAAAHEHGWGSKEYQDADHRLLLAERDRAAANGDPYVIGLDLETTWDPNASDPWLVRREYSAVLTLSPDMIRDRDRRLVVFEWTDCLGATLGPPNDDARSGHPLWRSGLRGCLWSGEVLNSSWIADLEQQNQVHPAHSPTTFAGLRHLILQLKDSTFEVLCRDHRLHRHPGPPLEAASAILSE